LNQTKILPTSGSSRHQKFDDAASAAAGGPVSYPRKVRMLRKSVYPLQKFGLNREMYTYISKIKYLVFFTILVFGCVLGFGIGISSPSFAQSSTTDDDDMALKETQDLLKNSKERHKAIKGDKKAESADDFVTQLTGGDANLTDDIYALASEVLENVMKNSGGDPEKMAAAIAKFQKDPAIFAATWTPAQKAKLRELAKKINKPQFSPK
jgi:hypothetical protein